MTKDTKDTVSKEMAGAVNLFAHPVAGAAALSAFGIGLASHAFGVWMGALTGAAGVSQRLFDPELSGQPGKIEKPVGSKAVPEFAVKPKRTKAEAGMQAAGKLGVTDDLKAISGVGPKLEHVLNGLGIRSYGQIAAWTAEDVALMEETLGFNGRIARDDWIGQAVALAAGETKH
jgi:NADH-quinone oxidoreductase subunit E